MITRPEFTSPLFHCDPILCLATCCFPCLTFHSTQMALDRSKVGSRSGIFTFVETALQLSSFWVPVIVETYAATIPAVLYFIEAALCIGSCVSLLCRGITMLFLYIKFYRVFFLYVKWRNFIKLIFFRNTKVESQI